MRGPFPRLEGDTNLENYPPGFTVPAVVSLGRVSVTVVMPIGGEAPRNPVSDCFSGEAPLLPTAQTCTFLDLYILHSRPQGSWASPNLGGRSKTVASQSLPAANPPTV